MLQNIIIIINLFFFETIVLNVDIKIKYAKIKTNRNYQQNSYMLFIFDTQIVYLLFNYLVNFGWSLGEGAVIITGEFGLVQSIFCILVDLIFF